MEHQHHSIIQCILVALSLHPLDSGGISTEVHQSNCYLIDKLCVCWYNGSHRRDARPEVHKGQPRPHTGCDWTWRGPLVDWGLVGGQGTLSGSLRVGAEVWGEEVHSWVHRGHC